MRLRYLKTLTSAPDALWVVLQSSPRLPWIDMVLDDMRVMKRVWGKHLDELGDPDLDSEKWWRLICDYPAEWDKYVDGLSTPEDDEVKKESGTDMLLPTAAGTFSCCGKAFASEKAWATHRRRAHDERSVFSQVVGDISACPRCGAEFHSRLRLLTTHLGDRRRHLACREFAAELPPLLEEVAAKLNDRGRVARLDARRQGHSHQIATRPAARSPRQQVVQESG